jgi:hypothetical protein
MLDGERFLWVGEKVDYVGLAVLIGYVWCEKVNPQEVHYLLGGSQYVWEKY